MLKHYVGTYAQSLLILALLSGALLAQSPAAVQASEIPPVGSTIFIQTNGPTAPIALGDWYSSAQNGVGGGYHYFGINVPCRWPTALDVHIDLFSPEMNTAGPLPRIDEPRGTLNNTIFELYGPGTPFNPPGQPGPGAAGSLRQTTYAGVTNRPEQWERFYTLAAPVACGLYLLRAETQGNDENGWRLRFGHDNDADPNNALPATYDNPDGQPGTGDETTISIAQTTYQHTRQGEVQCLLHYQFVKPNLNQVSFHNFDLDNNQSMTYYPPSAIFDPQGSLTPGAIAGTLSGFTVWNGGTQTARGTGDVVLNPEPGWWRMVTCVRSMNQFNQEGQTGVPVFREPVPEPDMVVAKDDRRSIVAAGDVLTYTISFANQSLSTKAAPGAAFHVVLTDTLPANTSYLSCRLLSAGLAGSCAPSGQQVIFTLDKPVFAGASGQLEVVARVNPAASGQVLNTVALDYQDLLNNPYPTVRAEDLDLIPTQPVPSVVFDKLAKLSRDKNGNGKADPTDEIAYTLAITNTGSVAADGLTIRDTPDANTALITGTVTLDQPGGQVLLGNGPLDRRVQAQLAALAPGASARLSFVVRVNPTLPAGLTMIANQALARGSNVPDTPSDDPRTPIPDDPTRVPANGPPGSGPPTAITLLAFGASATSPGTAEVRWITGAEIDTLGFRLLRATSANLAEAVAVGGLILAKGAGSYSATDAALESGVAYRYWLVEELIHGGSQIYGPATLAGRSGSATQAEWQLYLPLLSR
jgi:uncharacterized repeat protein (TIGR01451 family)